jgi:pyruvate,water dikinase
LDLYGFRCINELKLEELDLHDDPEFIFASIQSYLKTNSFHVADLTEREQKIRSAAEAVVAQHLSRARMTIFNFVLKNTRKAVKNRENLRFARTKVFGISRHLFRAMGRKLTQLGLLGQPDDIFYLTIDEILQFIEGRCVTQDIKSLTEMRKKEFTDYRETASLPDRLLTYGAVGASLPYLQVFMESDLLKKDQAELNKTLGKDTLVGTPCSPGIIEGRVRVVHKLQDAQGLAGDILVTARTDPGWVPLFPSCSALLIERGSLLSHSAVVARELGLPTIVGISGGLMDRLKTGDLVRVDASLGQIQILERAATQSSGSSNVARTAL